MHNKINLKTKNSADKFNKDKKKIKIPENKNELSNCDSNCHVSEEGGEGPSFETCEGFYEDQQIRHETTLYLNKRVNRIRKFNAIGLP